MAQNKSPGQFQNDQEWEAAIKDRFEGLHRKLAELIGEAGVLQVKCDRYEAALKEIRGDGQKFMPAKQDILLIIKEALAAGEGEKTAKEIEYMPVHSADVRNPGCPLQIPMHLLNEDQAQHNHGQSLKRLKERGGLTVTEMLAIIQRRKWQSMKWDDALKMLNDVLNQKEDKQ